MFVGVCFFELPNRYFLQKVPKSDPKREPKGGQKPPKWMMSDLSKHIVFTIRITFLAILHGLREHMFSTLLFGHCFLKMFRDFGCQKGTQNDRFFRGGNVSKTTPSPKSSQGAPREAQELPNDAKMLPEGTKMEPQGPQNLGFNIATMGTGT